MEGYFGGILAGPELAVEALGPFVVPVADAGVPAVEEVEFGGDLVAGSTLDAFSCPCVLACGLLE